MKQYHNILVHSLVNLGDVLLSTSAVALLKKAYPMAKITMMVRPAVAEVVGNNPVIDEVLIFDYQSRDRSIRRMISFIKEIKARQFDLCLSFDRKLRPALIAWLAGIPVRVGPDRVFDDKPSRVTMLYTDVVPIHHDLVHTLQAETYQAIVRGFTGIEFAFARPKLAGITAAHEAKAGQLLQELPGHKYAVALCVKGTFPLKDWPAERFAALIDRLAEQYDAAFFITGAPGDKEYADTVIRRANTPVTNFCGRTGLLDLAALLKKSDLFITVDTGAAHIAATTGVPMVTIYGCTTPDRWRPLTDNGVVIAKNPGCSPCRVAADGCPTRQCTTGITIDEVWAGAQKLVKNTWSGRR